MEVVCPKCRGAISPEGLNVPKDVAYCARCAEAYSMSQLLADAEALAIDVARPPKGTWFERTHDGFIAGASTRSPIAFFLVPFMTVWSGGALGGIYGTMIANGRFEAIQFFFGIPFVLGSILFWSVAVMAIAGKVQVERHGDELSVFTGVGPIGWTKRFEWSKLKRVEEILSGVAFPAQVRGRRRRTFRGERPQLTDARQTFLAAALTRMLAERRGANALGVGALALSDAESSGGELSPPED